MEELPPITLEDNIEMSPLETSVLLTGGAVTSVNGKTGAVVLEASDIGAASATALTAEVNARTQADNLLQSKITAETTSRQAADNGLQTSIANEITARTNADVTLQASIDTLKNNLDAEAAVRQDADTNLQSQIDAISAASDVTDVVGTYAQLRAYDTAKLKDNDIIKVLQDESQNDETTYYRWSIATQTFTLIGEEGPYYTKAAADAQFVPQTRTVNSKPLSSNVTLTASDVAAVPASAIVQTAGTSIADVMSQNATTSAISNAVSTKQDILTAGANITIDPTTDIISATDTTYTNFVGTDGTQDGSAGLVPAPSTTDVDKFLKSDGTWDTASSILYSTTGQNTDGAMTQKAVTDMVFYNNDTSRIRIGSPSIPTVGQYGIMIGTGVSGSSNGAITIGHQASTGSSYAIAIGGAARTTTSDSVAIGHGATATRTGEINVGSARGYWGYNGTFYRVLGGVHDGIDDHDAVTVGQLNAAIAGAGASTISSTDWSDLWQ